MRMNRSEIARLTGRTTQAVDKAVTGGRLSVDEAGLIDVDEARAVFAMKPRASGRQGAGAEPAGVRLVAAQARKTEAEARLAELKLAEQEGRLIDVHEAVVEVDKAFVAVRAKLLSIPSRFAPLFSPRDTPRAWAALEKVIHEMLVELQHSADDDQPPPAAPPRRAA